MANEARRAELAIYHLISNARSWNNYRLTHSASELSGFTCTSSLTMNEKFQYRTRPPSGGSQEFTHNLCSKRTIYSVTNMSEGL